MINEIKKILQNIQEQRPVKITAMVRGNYTDKEAEAIYNDAERQYHIKPPLKDIEEVSTVKSFRDYITEELKRRKKETGKFATAVINSTGGYFVADDDFQRGKCSYQRTLSEQWSAFKSCIGRTFDHEQFLRLMQKLSPSIVGFKELYPTLLDIRVVGRAESISKPFYVNGETETGVKLKFKMQNGEDEDIVLPESIKLLLPYAKGNYDILYEAEMQLVYENKGGINILIQSPKFEQVEEQALLDEVNFLKAQLEKFPDLLVLFNF